MLFENTIEIEETKDQEDLEELKSNRIESKEEYEKEDLLSSLDDIDTDEDLEVQGFEKDFNGY